MLWALSGGLGSAASGQTLSPAPAAAANVAKLSRRAEPEYAARRLADAKALLQLKSAPAAATLLWDVLAASPASDAKSDAEVLHTLGEALYQQGDLRTAQRIFTAEVELPAPSVHAPLALVRLLEIDSELFNDDRAAQWLNRLRSHTTPPPATNYVVGRHLLLHKRYDEARAVLARVPSADPYAFRARYLDGAALVGQNQLSAAQAVFADLVEKPLPAPDDDRRVVELSHLALGRIFQARGDFDKAHLAYLHISQKSDLFREAIYEAAWAALRAQNFERAEQSLSLLLLAYRDVRTQSYPATEAKLLLGNLLVRRGEPDAALPYFQQVLAEAAPLFEALAKGLAQPDSSALFAMLQGKQQTRHGLDLYALAPLEAAPLFANDKELGRFLALQKELGELGRALSEIEAHIALLERRLVSEDGSDVAANSPSQALSLERQQAKELRLLLVQAGKDAAQLGAPLLSAAGRAVHKKYAEVLLRAEAGTLDVAWAHKARHSERIAALVRDEKRELRILDDEFEAPAPKPDKLDGAIEPLLAERSNLPADLPADIAEDLQRYFATANSFADTLYTLGKEEYTRRRREVSSEYAERIHREEQEERTRRTQAIAQFEQFLIRHPQHPRFAPDAMFRLAELYYERSSEEFAAAVKKENAGSDVPGLPNYTPSIELYQKLLRDYSGYRLIDGVHYLLGYALGEMAKDAESRQAFLGLVCANRYRSLDAPAPWPGKKPATELYQGCQPKSGDERFVAEIWTRLGEQHFDRGELWAAIAAYTQVLPFRDSAYFDKALYKLAWASYRADRFSEAVRRFDELVVYADSARLNASGGDGAVLRKAPTQNTGSTLRTEAVQYLALSFAERDWNGDGRDDAEFGITRLTDFYRGRQTEPHVREVLVRLGDIWFERTEFSRAVAAYKLAIDSAPLSADNPKLQERIVTAYDRQHAVEKALRAREALSRDYAPGSPWYERNSSDSAALATASDLAATSLLHAITNRHASAQALRQEALAAGQKGKGPPDAKLLKQAREAYRQAAESYAAYLKQHPEGEKAYEYNYLYAESLFYAGDYAAAAAAYSRVRQSDLKGTHLEEAAYGAIKAQEHVALMRLRPAGESADADGDDVSQALDEKMPPLPAVGAIKPPVTALPLPQELEDLVVAYERYVAVVPESARAALMAYKAGELDFRYLNFDRARQRCALVLDRYCQSDRAVDAGNLILVSHTIEGNLDQVETWTHRLSQKTCGAGSALIAQQRDSLKRLSEDVSFKRAEQLLLDKHYDAAASMFVALVEKNPRAQAADKALNNAAVAYENLKRYATAAGLYERLVRDYPQSPLAAEALFRAAVDQERLFFFDKAQLAFAALATLPRYAGSPHRHDALYNAALLADREGDLALGIDLWRRYQSDPATTSVDAQKAAYRLALLVDKQARRSGSAQSAKEAISQWEQLWQRIASQVDNDVEMLAWAVEAAFRIGRARETLHSDAQARDSYAKALKLGQRLSAGSAAAEFAAHAAFLLAERRFEELRPLRIGGSGSELEQSISRYNSEVTAAIGEYEKVLEFRRATWTLAAYFRMGHVTELYAKALLAAPCPPEVQRLGEGACGLYREKIEENVAQIEEKAVARYAVTLEQAGRLGVGNVWTKEARARLGAYRPDKYPVLHDEHIASGLALFALRPSAPLGSGKADAESSSERMLSEARAALFSQKYENAMVLARHVLSQDERNVFAILILAQVYYQRNKLDLATTLVGAAQEISDQNGEAYLLLGLISLARDAGEDIAATAAFKKAVELDPNLGLGWHNLSAQYLHAKNYEEALLAAQKADSLLGDDGPRATLGAADVKLNLGSALRGLGRYSEANQVYRRIVERNPDYADGYLNLGVLYLDAPQFGDSDLLSQKRAAVQYLMRYQDLAHAQREQSADAYLKEARAAVDREERKLKRKTGGP